MVCYTFLVEILQILLGLLILEELLIGLVVESGLIDNKASYASLHEAASKCIMHCTELSDVLLFRLAHFHSAYCVNCFTSKVK